MKPLEGLFFSNALQDTRRAFDPLLHESLLDFDAVASTTNDVGLAVRRYDLANVGGLPARRDLGLIFPEIEHPTTCIIGGPSPDVRDLANDGLSVHVLEVHDVLPDHFGSDRMENRAAFESVGKQIVVGIQPS